MAMAKSKKTKKTKKRKKWRHPDVGEEQRMAACNLLNRHFRGTMPATPNDYIRLARAIMRDPVLGGLGGHAVSNAFGRRISGPTYVKWRDRILAARGGRVRPGRAGRPPSRIATDMGGLPATGMQA